MRKFLNKLFKGEIFYSAENCPPFLKRWTLIPSFITKLFGKDCGVFLHCIFESDRDSHDHPARFISFGIKGRYIDVNPDGQKLFKAPWIRTFPARYIHRIQIYPGEKAWTVVIIFPHEREFGFWTNGLWMPWKEYVQKNKCK